MQFHFWVRVEKLGNAPGFVRQEVVDDDVDLLFRFAKRHDLTEKIDKLFTGMACGSLAVHLARLYIQSSVK